METKGLGAGSYPEPPEIEEKEVEYRITVTYRGMIEVPKDWDKDFIESYIKANMGELEDLEEEEIEVEL